MSDEKTHARGSPYCYLFAAIPVGGEGNLASRKRTRDFDA
jgi:hypothetical protein